MRGPDAPQPADPPGSSWWCVRRLPTPVPYVRLSISLAGPAPSGSAGTSRHRQGRLPPDPGTSRVRLPSTPTVLLRQDGDEGLSPPIDQTAPHGARGVRTSRV